MLLLMLPPPAPAIEGVKETLLYGTHSHPPPTRSPQSNNVRNGLDPVVVDKTEIVVCPQDCNNISRRARPQRYGQPQIAAEALHRDCSVYMENTRQ